MLRTYTVNSRKCSAHPECIEGFREDRKLGLIYGPHRIIEDDGSIRWARDVEEASFLCGFCAYCNEED